LSTTAGVSLRLRDAVFVVVGPVLAIFISHVFASSLVQHMELGRRPTRREWIGTVVFESRFLLLAVPPVAILVILDLATVSLSDSIRAIIWLEALSLALWAGIAARSAGLRGRSLALAVLAGKRRRPRTTSDHRAWESGSGRRRLRRGLALDAAAGP
jgi:hypothetical protein